MDITVNFKGGQSFVNLPPVFSEDGENVFVCSRNSILEYHSKTGMLIHEYKGLQSKIVGFSYHKFDSYNCISACTKGGRVMCWKTITHFKLFEKQLPFKKVQTFRIVPTTSDKHKAFISYLNKTHINFTLVVIGENEPKKFKLRLESTTKNYYISLNNDSYCSVACNDTLYFLKLNNPQDISRVSLDTRTFTCVASHPVEEVVLTGDSSGRVIVWQNIFSKRKIQSVFHWHTLPVQSVCFSSSGSYFYSGGDECVLVKWQLENVNDRKFVPRLAAEINHINVAGNNLYVAVATRDNAIRIFDSTLYQTTLIQNLVLGKHYDCGIVYDPRTRALVMNGNQGQIQFYSPNDMLLLYNVDIVNQNKITNERECTLINTEIIKVDISKCGLWLATVEERKDDKYSPEIRLKFWKFDETKQTFELNTSIEYPHEQSINSMLFQPMNKSGNICCATVGNDKQFKVWQLTEFKTTYSAGLRWECLCVGFFRDLYCKSLSFSVDGSLMAVGFGSITTTWAPNTCELKCSLIHPVHKSTIKQVQFGHNDQCHLLVSVSQKQISVWNLLTLTMIWTVRIPVSFLIADPSSTYMAAFTTDKRVFVFSPAAPAPLYSSENLLRKYDTVVAAKFVPSKYSHDARMKWYERTQIYFISASNELHCLCSNELELDSKEFVEENHRSTYEMMLPNYKSNSSHAVTPIKHMFEKDLGRREIKKYLEFPIQTMAPIRFTCQSLIKSLVIQKEIT